jgi:hypothetical protein
MAIQLTANIEGTIKMPKKKGSTDTKQQNTQDASKQPSITSVTLDFPFGVDQAINQSDITSWRVQGEVYARILASKECPQSFRAAFGNIVRDQLLSKCDVLRPDFIAAFFPLYLICLQDSCPADAQTTTEILTTLRETLCDKLNDQITAEVVQRRK